MVSISIHVYFLLFDCAKFIDAFACRTILLQINIVTPHKVELFFELLHKRSTNISCNCTNRSMAHKKRWINARKAVALMTKHVSMLMNSWQVR